MLKYKTTKDIKISKNIVDQVIGQEESVNIIKKAALQRRHVLLIGEPGTGKCISSDAKIVLYDGSTIVAEDLYKNIKSKKTVIVQSINPDLTLSFSKILGAKTTKTKVLEITTNTGKKIKVSKEHPFLSINKKGINWKNSGELKNKNYIATPRILNSTKNIQSLEQSGKIKYAPLPCYSNVKEINIPKQITPEFAEFLGYLWSEGYISRKKTINFTNSEINLIERFELLAKNLFNLNTVRIYEKSKNAYTSIIYSVTLSELLYNFSWKDRVPPKIMVSPENVKISFLKAYFDGDGSATKRSFEVASKEKKVIEDIQTILLHFGINSIIKPKLKRAINSLMKPKLYYYLIIYDSENLNKFKKIGFSIQYKNEKLEKLCNRYSQSNIDKIPYIGQIIFNLKEKLRLTSEDIGVEPHQFRRYLNETRVPTRATVQKIVKIFSQRFYSIKNLTPMITTLGNIDLYQICSEIGISKTYLASKLNVKSYEIENIFEKQNSLLIPIIQQSMGDIINTEIENSLIGLYQLAFSDVLWEKIVDIKEKEEEILYDFEAEGAHNFIANNIIVHNSMVGQALAELLPKEKLTDILVFPNEQDENVPLIRAFPKGQGKKLVTKLKIQSMSSFKNQSILMLIVILATTLLPYYFWKTGQISDIIYASSMITSMIFLVGFIIFLNVGRKMRTKEVRIPKLLIDNSENNQANFIDGTGARAGALLGDVLHDPLQSGGLGTPAHERVTCGMIHRANNGVLFIDEIATLQPHTQQELLSALQEKKYPITGQSERSSGAMTRTEPVPCDFILVAAGNLEATKHMHPALRSRIRGYGYEVYMNETMDDNEENQDKLAVFVAQEVIKDKKIPHFTKEAVDEIIHEARKMAGISGKLTVCLRELGGLVRSAGDIAKEQNSEFVEKKHILLAKRFSRPLEQQLADKYIENKKKYQVIKITGQEVGRVNGLAVIGTGTSHSGIVLPIESEVTFGGKRADFIATGKLGEIAKEAVKNVSAIILKYFGEDIKEKYDIFIQFLQTTEGVEGDSASIAVATAIISALKKIPVRQDTAMTGSLSVRGEVLAIGGVTAKVEAAIEAGIKRVIIPKTNENDLILSKEQKEKIKIIPAETIKDVLKEALIWKGKESILKKIK